MKINEKIDKLIKALKRSGYDFIIVTTKKAKEKHNGRINTNITDKKLMAASILGAAMSDIPESKDIQSLLGEIQSQANKPVLSPKVTEFNKVRTDKP